MAKTEYTVIFANNGVDRIRVYHSFLMECESNSEVIEFVINELKDVSIDIWDLINKLESRRRLNEKPVL